VAGFRTLRFLRLGVPGRLWLLAFGTWFGFNLLFGSAMAMVVVVVVVVVAMITVMTLMTMMVMMVVMMMIMLMLTTLVAMRSRFRWSPETQAVDGSKEG